jgi:hypothetical protein
VVGGLWSVVCGLWSVGVGYLGVGVPGYLNFEFWYLFSRMQQQDEPSPEAGGKTRTPNIEIRNKFELPKFKCSKRCRESPY